MKVDGVKEASADAKKKSAWVKFESGKVAPQKLVETINTKTNFKASLESKK